MDSEKSIAINRKGERGAALITSILISTLLLAVAGTVILTSGMSATTSIDATAELQAYYGAESGLEAALDVVRGNVAPHSGVPAGTKMGFRNAVDSNFSNRGNDHSSQARLSGWLTYGANERVTPAGANYSYSVVLIDPDDPTGAIRNADASYRPKRIQVQSTGYGPHGSVKHMEMIVEKTHFDFTPACTVCGRSADSGAPINWGAGSSNAKFYSGHDNATLTAPLPTFGVTTDSDVTHVLDSISKPSTVEEVRVAKIEPSSLPEWLQTADNAREFLNYMQGIARSMGHYYTSLNGSAGTTTSPTFTFVNGDATLAGGAGLLVVTGNLVLDGNQDFNGVVLVLGNGSVTRSGSGNGNLLGSMYVAKFARSWPSSENGLPHPFLAPTFDTNGGGNGDFRFDSAWVNTAKDVLGNVVRDVREY